MEAFYSLPNKRRRFAGKAWDIFFTCIQGLCICVFLFWIPYSNLPKSGVAVVLIGVAAAVMSIHDDRGDLQKVLWIAILTSLMITELRSIKKDRQETHEQYLKDQDAQNKAFAAVLKQQSDQFTETKNGFDATELNVSNVLAETKRVDGLARENLLSVTATDSFAVVYPEFIVGSNEGYWKIHNYGKHLLLGVQATINIVKTGHYSVGGEGQGLLEVSDPILIGNVPGTEGRQFPANRRFFTPQIRNDGICEYVIYVTSQSYSTTENITIRPAQNGFQYSLVAWRNLDAINKKPDDLPTKNKKTVTRVLKQITWKKPLVWEEQFKLP